MANEIEKGIKKVKVYSTDKDVHHKTGESWEVTEAMAASLVERGLVTTKAPKGSKEE